MKTNIFVIPAIIISLLLIPVQVAKAGEWALTCGGAAGEEVWCIEPTTDGGLMAAGWTESFQVGQWDGWLVRTDAHGAVLWQKTYGGTAGDLFSFVIQTDDGGYVGAGETASFGSCERDIWVLKLDPQGAVEWQKVYGGAGDELAVSVQQTTDGGFIVAGETLSFGAGEWDVWVLKLDARGAIEWQKTYGGAGLDTTSADPLQQTADGGYILAGRTASWGSGELDLWVLKLDVQGAIQWQRAYGGKDDDQAKAVRQTADGGYLVAGYAASQGVGGKDFCLLRLDAQGNILWQRLFGGTKDDLCWSVRETPDGGCILAGQSNSIADPLTSAWVLKLDAGGGLEWHKSYWGHGGINSVRPLPSGGYVLAGENFSLGAGNYDYFILKTDANGDIPGCNLIAYPGVVVTVPTYATTETQAQGVGTDCLVSDTGVVPAQTAAVTEIHCANP
jgi:hypothetical protein